MTKFDIYSLILCLIVFVLLVGVLSYMLAIIIKQELKHVKAGLEDEDIFKEFNTNSVKKQRNLSKIISTVLNALLCIFFGAIFLSSLYINCTQNVYFDDVPTFRVVLTSSMENKNEKNKYLFDNNLNDQISAFDLITTYKIPNEEDLKCYDIIVYEVDGILVVHRIVGIEEPNSAHPNERHFLMQGDSVGSPDRFPVLYSQMKGIYKGEKIPFIGSFVLFMQSPAGWLCILLIVVAMISTPILEKKLFNARESRFLLLEKEQEETVAAEVYNVDFNASSNENTDPSPVNLKQTKTFNGLLPSKKKSFTQKLEISPIASERFIDIKTYMETINGIRAFESKYQTTYKFKNIPVVKFTIKGKTLNAYLGLTPKDYENTKYIFTDVSATKKYSNYPMRVKVSSNRQVKWVKELIQEIVQQQ